MALQRPPKTPIQVDVGFDIMKRTPFEWLYEHRFLFDSCSIINKRIIDVNYICEYLEWLTKKRWDFVGNTKLLRSVYNVREQRILFNQLKRQFAFRLVYNAVLTLLQPVDVASDNTESVTNDLSTYPNKESKEDKAQETKIQTNIDSDENTSIQKETTRIKKGTHEKTIETNLQKPDIKNHNKNIVNTKKRKTKMES